ncbi:MAG: DMT family transporter [Acetobacteraceae bacterium]
MSRMPQSDDPIRGIALSLLATVLFSVADVTSKYLSAGMPIIEIAWIRYVIFLGMAALLVRQVPRGALWPRSPLLQIARACCLVGSAVLFVFGVRHMTMAQATTISFLSPLLITLLSIPLLGEVVGVRRWAAVIAGLIGVLVVVRPGSAGFEPAALYGLASSTCWSLALIITRKMAGSDHPSTTVLWSAAVGLAILTVLLPFEVIWPTAAQWALAIMFGVLASLGQWVTVLAHQYAPASLLAPFAYFQLPCVTLGGYLVFTHVPDAWTLAGAAIIITSGLYTAHRERLRARA